MPDLPIQDIDKACINLCVAMNKLPGIETVESCCGHGESPYRIWFKMDTNSIGAIVLARCLSGRYYNYAPGELRNNPVWRAYISDTECFVCFLLEGKQMPGNHNRYLPADKLAENIMEHIDEDFAIMKKVFKDQYVGKYTNNVDSKQQEKAKEAAEILLKANKMKSRLKSIGE